MKPQEHIDLSLKWIKNPPEPATDGKINVSEMNTKEIINKLKLNPNTVDNVLLGSGWNPRGLNNTLPRRINRATMKLEAAKVILLIFVLNFPLLKDYSSFLFKGIRKTSV